MVTPQKVYRFKVHLLGLGVPYINTYDICKCTLKKRLEIDTRTPLRYLNCEIQTWCSDLRFSLDVQTWSSDLMFRLEFRLGNLQSRIEDWRFSRALLGESSIQDWRLKILQDSCWGIFNPGLKIEDWKFPRTLLGESSVQDWGFNIKGSLLDWRFSKKSPGESSIFSPGLKIPHQESWRIFNLQSSILDCSQSLRGIRRRLKLRRCHRLRSLRKARQLSESSLSPKSLRLKSQCF